MVDSFKKFIPKRIRKTVYLLIHKGNRYVCPFCNYSSKDLAPIGLDIPVLKEKQVVGAGMRSAGCHNCGSSDRERLIYVYLKEKLRIFSNNNIRLLHIAPETNLSKKLLAARLSEYICGDLFADGYQYPAHVKNMNILSLPYNSQTFDLVICNHVLEHIPDDRAAMKELRRVLKNGGTAILQVPVSKNSMETFEDFSITQPDKRKLLFGQPDHVRIYGQDYVQRLTESGFEVTRENLFEEFKQYGLNKEEDIFVCRKGNQ